MIKFILLLALCQVAWLSSPVSYLPANYPDICQCKDDMPMVRVARQAAVRLGLPDTCYQAYMRGYYQAWSDCQGSGMPYLRTGSRNRTA